MDMTTPAAIEPGLYFDISNEAYHSGPGVSKSALDKIARSPAHYFAHYLDPKRPPPSDPTPAMLTGTLAHCAILEPAEFDKRYVVVPADAPRKPTEAQRNAKKPSDDTLAAIAWWDSFAAANGDKLVIDAEQRAKAFAQSEALRRLPDLAEAFGKGFAEASAYWIDEATGLLCKCRPDWVYDCGDAGVVLVDVKTTTDASPREFQRSVAKWRYHVQAAWYSDGFEKATGRTVLAFVFAAVDNEWPHMPSAMMLDYVSITEGRNLYRRDLDRLAGCMAANEWPGYSQAIETISIPTWAFQTTTTE